MVYTYDKNHIEDLLEKLQNEDTVEIRGRDFIDLLSEKNTGSKGRKPIHVESSLFNEVVSRWQNSEITARQAMQILNLKPNTFYRRIKELKERSNEDMKDIKEELKDIHTRIHEDAEEIRQTVADKKEILGMKREIRHDRIGAKIDHVEDVIAMKRAVSKETEQFKETESRGRIS